MAHPASKLAPILLTAGLLFAALTMPFATFAATSTWTCAQTTFPEIVCEFDSDVPPSGFQFGEEFDTGDLSDAFDAVPASWAFTTACEQDPAPDTEPTRRFSFQNLDNGDVIYTTATCVPDPEPTESATSTSAELETFVLGWAVIVGATALGLVFGWKLWKG